MGWQPAPPQPNIELKVGWFGIVYETRASRKASKEWYKKYGTIDIGLPIVGSAPPMPPCKEPKQP